MANTPKPILKNLAPDQTTHALALLDEFVDRSGGPNACWPWTGGTFVRGYGCFYTLGTAKTRRMIKAHRLAYEVAHDGDCPPTIDHECHDSAVCELGETCPHRRCCNPAHLAGKSQAANAARAKLGIYSERCGSGHLKDETNTYRAPDGSRRCRACAAAWLKTARKGRAKPAAVKRTGRRPYGMATAELVVYALDGLYGDGCWFSPLATVHDTGYALVRHQGRMQGLHRLVYGIKVGPIPEGRVIDHACHDPQMCPGGLDCPHRACVNPDHLVAVPHAVNTGKARSSRKRPDRCKHGHEFTPENTYTDARGSRHCKTCSNERQQDSRDAAKREAGWVDPRFREGNLCRNGHDVAVTGLRPGGTCAECARERNREYKTRLRLERAVS